MADQLKEIYNNTVYIGQLSNGVTVASTNSTTQLVIKDAQVSNNTVYSSLGITPTLAVNNSLVASLQGSVSGSEIIDVSSSAIVTVPAVTFLQTSYATWGITSNTPGSLTSYTNKTVNGVLSNSSSSSVSINGTGYSGQIWNFWTIGSDFYFFYGDGNSTTYLIRKAGGPTGTESNVTTSSWQPWTRGATDKLHTVDATVIKTYNATANTITSSPTITHPNWGSTISSYPRTSFANGLVFYVNSYYGASALWAFNPTTGKGAYITTSGSPGPAGNTVMEVCYIGGFYYAVFTDNTAASTGNIYVYRIADFGGLTTTDISVSGTLLYTMTGAYVPLTNPYYNYPKLDPVTGDFYHLTSTSGNVFTYKVANVVQGIQKSNFVVTMPGSSSSNNVLSTPNSVDDSANKLNTTFYPQSMRLRITGVQSTL